MFLFLYIINNLQIRINEITYIFLKEYSRFIDTIYVYIDFQELKINQFSLIPINMIFVSSKSPNYMKMKLDYDFKTKDLSISTDKLLITLDTNLNSSYNFNFFKDEFLSKYPCINLRSLFQHVYIFKKYNVGVILEQHSDDFKILPFTYNKYTGYLNISNNDNFCFLLNKNQKINKILNILNLENNCYKKLTLLPNLDELKSFSEILKSKFIETDDHLVYNIDGENIEKEMKYISNILIFLNATYGSIDVKSDLKNILKYIT